MKRIEKESAKHGTPELNFALYDHASSTLPIAIEAHWHPEYEINYVYQGPVTFFMGGQSYTLHANEFLFVEKNRIHSCFDSDAEAAHYVSIVFGEDFVFSSQKDSLYQKYLYPLYKKHLGLPAAVTAAVPGGTELSDCIRQFLSIYSDQNFAYELGLRAQLLRFFHLALEHDIFVESQEHEPALNSIVHQALTVIRQNYTQPLSISELAASCHVTHSYFCRLFKSFVGKSPKEYLLDYRIAAASSLLAQTEDSVSAIAYACGFDDLNYFARCFKKRNGLSPTEYRKRSHELNLL